MHMHEEIYKDLRNVRGKILQIIMVIPNYSGDISTLFLGHCRIESKYHIICLLFFVLKNHITSRMTQMTGTHRRTGHNTSFRHFIEANTQIFYALKHVQQF